MSSRLQPAASYEHPVPSSNNTHRLRNPEVLACKACRKKKHFCDRKQPFCTRCSNAGADCVYPNRKLPVTPTELEGEVRRLEEQYAACLRRAGIGAKTKSSTKSITTAQSFQCVQEARAVINWSSIATTADGGPCLDHCKHGQANIDPPFGGYHFDESFLTIPSYVIGTPPPIPEISSGSNQLEHSNFFTPIRRDRARVFTPASPVTPRNTSSLSDGPLILNDPCQTEEERSSKRRRLKSPLEHILDQSKPRTSELGVPMDKGSTPPPPPHQHCPSPSSKITNAPTLDFSRATWWDCLLSAYAIRPEAPISRRDATAEISLDVYRFFKDSTFLLSFLNVPMFFDTFCHPERRAAVQPALVLSMLAYAKLMQSNHDASRGKSLVEREGAWGQSVQLRDMAQASFEASYNAGWIDLPLVEAAWILVIYELSPHRAYTSQRLRSSVDLLENVIRYLDLTAIDANDPRTTTFNVDAIPAGQPRRNNATDQTSRTEYGGSTKDCQKKSHQTIADETRADVWRYPVDRSSLQQNSYHGSGPFAGCPCPALSLSRTPELLQSTPSWMFMPKWPHNASLGEIMKEQARRLVWSSVIIVGSDAVERQVGGFPRLNLLLSKPENFALMFPGEVNYSSLPGVDMVPSGKESNWALWARSTLLWFACLRRSSCERQHISQGLSESLHSYDEDIVVQSNRNFAMRAWMETVAIEGALDAHTCYTEQSMMCQARELIFKIRMQLSRCFRNTLSTAQTGINPSHLERESAQKWAEHADRMGMTFLNAASQGEDSPSRKMLADRPFISGVCLGAMLRALELWKLDRSLSLALDAARKLCKVVDWYQEIWPCADIQKLRASALRELE